MSNDEHPKRDGETEFADDFDRNPGIGQSKGSFATGVKPSEIEGDNTVEGDVENDPNAQGGVDGNRLGRTNE